MCGIAGLLKFSQPVNPDDIQAVERMTDGQKHRGPDDSGLFHDEHTVLGHRRLSVIDLSSLGHQPMADKDESIWITFNGEIYNFLEIRRELKLLGHQFKSNSDTEVVLKAYREWGEESFKRFIGMFCFCILDKQFHRLYLVRDHAGIKPLYYYICEEGLIFASEVRAFKAFDKNWEEENTWKIYFFIFGHIPEPFTTLKDVFMLAKGSFLIVDLRTRRHEIKRYEEIPFREEIRERKEASERVKTQLTYAIERHLISDAPLGVFLSGGIDSSLLALTIHHCMEDHLKLRTLSVIFEEKEFSEKNYQEIVAKKINSAHRPYLVTEEDFKEDLEDIFQAMDQPSIDGINTYFVSKCAKQEGLKSVLSGLGGDELFGGYPSFRRIGVFWPFRKINENIHGPLKLFQHMKSDRFKKLSFLSLANPLSYYLLFRGLFAVKETASILNAMERDALQALERVHFEVDPNLGKGNFTSSLETNLYMQNQLLKDTDFMSMWHSVEIRVPYLDKELMKLLFSICEEVKFDKRSPKFLLTSAFENLLPKEIAARKKQGFTFPVGLWIKRQGRGFYEEAVTKGGLDKKVLTDLWNRFEHNTLHWSRIWAPIVFSIKQNMFS